jgi:predicted nucleic acid-binding protein
LSGKCATSAIAVKIVDASALAAILFREPEREKIARRLEGARLMTPALLFKSEIANVRMTRLRRHPENRAGFPQAFELRSELAIETAGIDFVETLYLAERTGLTAYDASYLWLAWQIDVALVTLDRALARAVAAVAPSG